MLALAGDGVDVDLAVQADADGRRIDAHVDRLEIALGHVDRGRGLDVLVLSGAPR